jgi:CubicO group peptidase (beta-lactamase class C family)
MQVKMMLCAALAVLLAVGGASADAQELDAATKAKVESEIHRVMQETGVPSAEVGIARGGKVIYAAAFGDARIAYEGKAALPATSEMHYAVGSISKQFTATCILLLQEQGKLKLDDPVAKWFPELTRANDITLRMLLTHTSGYSDYAPQDYIIPEWTKPTQPIDLVHQWAEKPLDFEPGTKWQYSNTNYVIAGLIVEKVSGESFDRFLSENVLQPLHLHDVLDLNHDRKKMEPTGYRRNALGPLRPSLTEAPGWLFADGGLAMPVRTLMEWDISLLSKTLLKPESYAEMFKEQRLKDGGPTSYGLGLQVGRRNGRLLFGHSGEIGGFVAMNMCMPNDDVAIAVLTNLDASDAAGELAQALVPILLPPTTPPAASATPSATTEKARAVLVGLQKGEIDRSQFTSNANFYFSQQALDDFHASLAPLGALTSFTEHESRLRGGMQMRVYTAKFATQSLTLITYWMPDGKIEQFLASGSN